jgi:redox-sensitive bicupin YhaK (pirin superfamily)
VTRRPLPGRSIEHLDPFLFLNHHGPQVYPPGNRGLPFGPHPHRGFETVTFILAGELAHRDTGGHESIIHEGGVQWMTAGRGLVHAELSPEEFKRRGGPLEILQLWVNLPARLKMTEPAYVGLEKDNIPSFEAAEGRARVNLISGTWDGRQGPVQTLADVHMMVLKLDDGARMELPVSAGRTVFFYVVNGTVEVGGTQVEAYHLVELGNEGGAVAITAGAPTTILFGHAQPFSEPIVARGPFVMNTHQEILQTFQDYEKGLFG